MHLAVLVLLLVGCGGRAPAENGGTTGTGTTTGTVSGVPTADVVSVSVSGDEGAYDFAVTIRSDETGCDRYADWWEVVSDQGDLVHRRILNHSHPDEQPFTRSGGPVPVSASATLVIRAHLHPEGYVGQVLRGSVAGGFAEAGKDPGLAPDLEEVEPLPESCWF